MTKETEAIQRFNKTLELLKAEKNDAKRADIILEHFAYITNSKQSELVEDLKLKMRKDISPYDRDIVYIRGVKEGLMMARQILDECDIVNLRMVEQLSVAFAVLTKLEYDNVA